MTARIFIVVHGAGALQEAKERADQATIGNDLVDLVRWSRVSDAIVALEEGDAF